MLTCANARLIAAYGTPAQVAAFGAPQIAGRWLGTMCLSEPQAGSSLSDIATRAAFECDDPLGPRYRLAGNKMWISGGDHDLSDNIVHLVLAKVPGADGRLRPGTGSIALFIVPKLLIDAEGRLAGRNDIAVAGLNHKMGYRGTTNCLLNFGEGTAHRPFGRAGAVGYRLGGEGEGLAIMFHMMNEARIAVGLGAAALACRGYHHARAYARERLQGRPLGSARKDSAQAPRPIIEHADVKRMLLTQKAYAEGALALVLYCARLVDEEATAQDARARDEVAALLGLLTPVAKSWPSEFGPVANDLAIQVHGGYGYTRDFDVEQVYRDNRLNPIHEGTHGIQAIDLVARKVVRDRGAALALLGARIRATAARAEARPELAAETQALRESWGDVLATAETLIALGDVGRAVADASWFLSAFGHVVVAWLWLDQVLAAMSAEVDATLRAGKQAACRFFAAAELPNARRQLAYVRSLNGLTTSVAPELL
jgi:alkylation response protein AidB-like acyl-CoA dehydrogenase